MVDQASVPPSDAVEHCPWCSASIAPALQTCPACGATLVGDSEAPLPGVTALDQEAIARANRTSTPQRRNRVLSWISGEYPEPEEAPVRPGSLAPPPPEVRREMLRLALAAEVANLSAEAGSLAAEAEVESRVHQGPPTPPAPPEPESPEGGSPPA